MNGTGGSDFMNGVATSSAAKVTVVGELVKLFATCGVNCDKYKKVWGIDL